MLVGLCRSGVALEPVGGCTPDRNDPPPRKQGNNSQKTIKRFNFSGYFSAPVGDCIPDRNDPPPQGHWRDNIPVIPKRRFAPHPPGETLTLPPRISVLAARLNAAKNDGITCRNRAAAPASPVCNSNLPSAAPATLHSTLSPNSPNAASAARCHANNRRPSAKCAENRGDPKTSPIVFIPVFSDFAPHFPNPPI